jgi:vesicle-fusing ATPase
VHKVNRITEENIDRLPELASKAKNFSGAVLEGIVKAAISSYYALTRRVDVKDLSKAPDNKNLVLEYPDFERALCRVQVWCQISRIQGLLPQWICAIRL